MASATQSRSDLKCTWDTTPDSIGGGYHLTCADEKPNPEEADAIKAGCAEGIAGLVYPDGTLETKYYNLALALQAVASSTCPDGSPTRLTAWAWGNVVLWSSSPSMDDVAKGTLGTGALQIQPLPATSSTSRRASEDPAFGAGGCVGLVLSTAGLELARVEQGGPAGTIWDMTDASMAAVSAVASGLSESQRTLVEGAIKDYIVRVLVLKKPRLDQEATYGIYQACGQVPPWSGLPRIPGPPTKPSDEDLPQFNVCYITVSDYPSIRPSTSALDCRSIEVLTGLHWSEWGRERATGTGTLDVPDPTSSLDYRDAPRIRTEVDVELDQPVLTSCGLFFSRVVITPRAGPNKGRADSYRDLAPGTRVPVGTPENACWG